jgi:hypothetical protein
MSTACGLLRQLDRGGSCSGLEAAKLHIDTVNFERLFHESFRDWSLLWLVGGPLRISNEELNDLREREREREREIKSIKVKK